jgi:aconitate decarboxylase
VTGPSPTAQLSEFAASLRFDDLPPAVVEHAKLCLLDTIGCGIFGSSLEWSRILRETVAATDSSAGASIWGRPDRTSAPNAALVNGTAVHAFELDDLHVQSIVHPGSTVSPAAMTLAEAQAPVTGRAYLTAQVAGYEVAARAGMTVGAAHLRQGWHPTGTHGTLGAAAAAGSVLGLDTAGMINALGIAGTQSSGLMAAQYASMVKRMHAGRAAQSGVYAALLAQNGFTGIGNLFESEYGGYCTTFSPEHDLSPLTAGLGERWEAASIGFKPYPTNGSCHPTIDALLEVRGTESVTLEDVAGVEIRASSATKDHVGWRYDPDSVTTAQMNLPFITAAVLADGEATVRQFTKERIRDPRLVDFARSRVTVIADPRIDAMGDACRHYTEISIRRADGSVLTLTRTHARGSREFPLTPGEVAAKFATLADTVFPQSQVSAIRNTINDLESLSDMRVFTRLLQPLSAASLDKK